MIINLIIGSVFKPFENHFVIVQSRSLITGVSNAVSQSKNSFVNFVLNQVKKMLNVFNRSS